MTMEMRNQKEEIGIKETKELFALIIQLSSGVFELLRDGGSLTAVLSLLMSVADKIDPAFRGSGSIPLELKDLSEQEAQELKLFFEDMFDQNEKFEEKVKAVFRIHHAFRYQIARDLKLLAS